MHRFHKIRQPGKRVLLLLLILAIGGSSGTPGLWAASPGEHQGSSGVAAANPSAVIKQEHSEPFFANVLQQWKEQNVKEAITSFSIKASALSGRSDNKAITTGQLEGRNVLLWNGHDSQWVEYQLTVPESGLYEIAVTYRPLGGNGIGNPVVWDVQVDGKRAYHEASSITLYRDWKDVRPILKNDDGDEVRPRSIEAPTWRSKSLIDSAGAYDRPLLWNLNKGIHTIRFSGNEPVALEEIRFIPPQKIPTYAEAAAAYPQSQPVQAPIQVLQGEEFETKNDTSIKLFSDTNPRTVPTAKGRITYNTIGGRRWQYSNQEVTWQFEAPETGKYKIAMRSLQNQISQKSSFRTIRIDGSAPFQEWLSYRLPYDSGWKGTVLEQNDGKPFELYLEKGKHTLSLAVTHAPVKPVLLGIDDASLQLRGIEQDLRALTGGLVDRNRTWKVKEEIPDLAVRLEQAAKKLKELSVQLEKVNGRKDNISQGLDTSAKDIAELLTKVDDIPYYTDEIASMNEKISQFIEILLQQPLQLDEIYIAPAEKSFPSMEASWLREVSGSIVNFFYSFQPRNSLSNMDERLLNIWVQRGRDYVDQLQQLADEQFTPETGIKVKVNLLPTSQLLVMSNAAGVQPDIALGLTQDLPVDYAIRGSVVDLSKFPDFESIYKRFSPGSWLPLYYNKGYYALPETQMFQVLFYRKDILSKLNLSIPQTWDDVYNLLPILQQNSFNFYMNPKDYIPFFYQNHVNLYQQDGLKTALDSPQGFKAFKQWSDLYNTYALEREVPSFYQHFRRGTMPIGISDYNMYVQLMAAAPELTGRWGIALIPGVKQPDGTIERWAGGGQRTGVIFKESKKKEQAWTFMKWWVSAKTQEQFGNDIEAVNGVAFRWNTTNIEAFMKLPWKPEDAQVILKQWSWYKDVPNLPGGYYLDRELNNAWLRTVVDGMNYRNSLENAVLDIDRELRRKQQEFGYVDAAGRVIKTLELPVISKPWEGVNAYVK